MSRSSLDDSTLLWNPQKGDFSELDEACPIKSVTYIINSEVSHLN